MHKNTPLLAAALWALLAFAAAAQPGYFTVSTTAGTITTASAVTTITFDVHCG